MTKRLKRQKTLCFLECDAVQDEDVIGEQAILSKSWPEHGKI